MLLLPVTAILNVEMDAETALRHGRLMGGGVTNGIQMQQNGAADGLRVMLLDAS